MFRGGMLGLFPVGEFGGFVQIIVATLPLLFLGAILGQTPDPVSGNHYRATGLLNQLLKDKNPDTRKHAVQALGLVGPREPYISQAEAMLEDKDVEVRVSAITSLVDLKNERTASILQKPLDSEVPEVSFAAAKGLWALQAPEGREALLSVLSGESKTKSAFITRQKREALRMFHTPKTMFLFVLQQGANLAPVPGLGAGVSSVEGILSDASISGRAATALLLSTDKDPRVLQALRDALADKEWSVRASGAHAIALRNDPSLATNLVPLFDDTKEAVRARAAAGYLRLESIKPAPVKPAPPKRAGKK
jgi:HEAT repeat protein